MNSYRDLIVWQKSMDLVEEIYGLVKYLPKEEQYALSDQMRRACVSIPSNIAEGYDRGSTKEYIQFLTIARGSKSEIETQLYVCLKLKYLTGKQIENALGLCDEVGRMINSILRKLKSN